MNEKKRTPVISVIVPVYKVEPYLRQCIDSILAQTFRDFELILVDDGSPDNCGAICDEYAAMDDRITVIHQENGGLSAARNAGIDWVFANSESQWITFVDSDDYIIPWYLEYLYNGVQKTGAEISTSGPLYFTQTVGWDEAYTKSESVELYTGREATKNCYNKVGRVYVMAWGKLFRRELLEECRFPVGKIHEDQYLIPKLLYKAKCVAVLAADLYGYRQTPGSIMNSQFSIRRFDDVEGVASCEEFFRSQGDRELTRLSGKLKKEMCAECVLRAKRSGLDTQIPESCRMSPWTMWYYVIKNTVARGGVRFMMQRIKNALKK